MFVFDPTHAELQQRTWKVATLIEITPPTGAPRTHDEIQSLTEAKVSWLDGSVSSGHLVQRMRYLHSAETPYVYF